jgi:uncharacterized protein (DUF2336 family)
MTSLVSFIAEIEEAVGSEDPIRRIDALRRVTALFVAQAPSLNEGHVDVFDAVILRLSTDLELRARSELSERLADIANAPRRTVRTLADDGAIEVAGPVLERSPRLEEADLLAIARRHGQGHLLALSKRSALSGGVAEVLVERGDARVAHALAGNAGARVSEDGLAKLLDRAQQGDAALGDLLRTRRDLPPRHLARLVEIARERVRETLREEFDESVGAAVNAAVDGMAQAVAEAAGAADPDGYAAAAAGVARKAEAGGLVEDDVVEWIKAGRLPEALTAIAHLAGLPTETVVRAYEGAHHDPLLFIVRSVRFGWATFKLLLTLRAGRQPSAEVLKSAFEGFQQLSVQTAQRVVRFTAARERAAQTDAA